MIIKLTLLQGVCWEGGERCCIESLYLPVVNCGLYACTYAVNMPETENLGTLVFNKIRADALHVTKLSKL